MTFSHSAGMILGAVLGIAVSLLVPSIASFNPGESSDDDKNIRDPNDQADVNKKNPKFYEENTLWDILRHVGTEFLDIWKNDANIIIPYENEDVKSHSTNLNIFDENPNNLNITLQPLGVSASEHVCVNIDETEYIECLNPRLTRTSSNKERVKDKVIDPYNDARCFTRDLDSKNLQRQSTLIEEAFEDGSNNFGNKKTILIPIGQETLQQFENIISPNKERVKDARYFTRDLDSKSLRRESTLIEETSRDGSKNFKIKKSIPVPIGQEVLQQFESMINTKFEFSNISVENNCIIINFEKSPSRVQKIFKNVRNILRLKKSFPQNNNSTDVKTTERIDSGIIDNSTSNNIT